MTPGLVGHAFPGRCITLCAGPLLTGLLATAGPLLTGLLATAPDSEASVAAPPASDTTMTDAQPPAAAGAAGASAASAGAVAPAAAVATSPPPPPPAKLDPRARAEKVVQAFLSSFEQLSNASIIFGSPQVGKRGQGWGGRGRAGWVVGEAAVTNAVAAVASALMLVMGVVPPHTNTSTLIHYPPPFLASCRPAAC